MNPTIHEYLNFLSSFFLPIKWRLIQVNLDMTDSMGPGKLVRDMQIRRIHMTNTWYASDWDQAYRPSYAKTCHTVVRHTQVHLYNDLPDMR